MAERLSEARIVEDLDRFDVWLREGGNADVADVLQSFASELAALAAERDEARTERNRYKESLAALVEVTEADHRDRIALEEERDEVRQQVALFQDAFTAARETAIQMEHERDAASADADLAESALTALQGACEQLAKEWQTAVDLEIWQVADRPQRRRDNGDSLSVRQSHRRAAVHSRIQP